MGCCCSLLLLPRQRQHQQQRQGITTAVQVEIPRVPPALVWDVVTDLSALPQTSPFVQGVELWKTPEPDNTTTSKTKTCFVGQQWREERNVPGKDNHNDGNNLQTQVKTVVRMDTNDTTSNNKNDNDDDKEDYNYRIGRTLTVNVMHKKKRNNRGTKNNSATRYSTVDVSNTCSWTVVQASHDDKDDDDDDDDDDEKEEETSTTTILICSIAYTSTGNWGGCLRRILLHYAEEYLRQELQGYKATALERHAAATAAATAAIAKP